MFIRYFLIITLLFGAYPQLLRAQETPASPSNVQAAAIEGAQAARITWQASATPGVSYRIYRSQSSGSTGSAIASFLSELAYTDNDLVFNSTYYYRLVAMLSGVESPLSAQVSVKPIVPPPINVRASDTKKGGEIKVSWDRPAAGMILKFTVYRSTTDSSLGSSVISSYEGTEYFDTGATNNTYYYYRVASVYANGQASEPSATVIGISSDATAPEKPTVYASASEGGKVSISWTVPRNEQGLRYFVYRSGSAGDLGSQVIETTGTSLNESALNPNQTLYYRVIAKDGAGNTSAASDSARVVTIGTSSSTKTQYKVTELVAEGTLNRGEIQLRWKPANNSDIVYSRLYRRETGSDSASMIADKVYGSSYLDKTVASGKRYYYFVRLVDKSNYEYDASSEASATSFTEKSTSQTSAQTPAPAQTAKPVAPVVPAKPKASSAKSYAYGRPRMANLKLEAALANDLRKALIKKLGAKKVPARLNQSLIKAYIYGGYNFDELARTLIGGKGLVHPSVRAADWRKSAEYQKRKKS